MILSNEREAAPCEAALNFFLLLILITAAIVVFLLGTLLGVFPIVRPYLAEGPVIALSLPVAGEDGLQALLSGQATQNRLRNCCGRLWNRLLPPA